jgi:hypothetical protein
MAHMADLTLTVAVATIGARIQNLTSDQFPPMPGVTYHIFAQDLAPGAASPRPDIRLTALQGAGVACSRNAALTVDTDLLLFADDDLVLLTQSYPALMRAFAEAPQIDVLCGRLLTPEDQPRKNYGHSGPQNRWTISKFGTPEIALRPARIRAAGVQFDEGFGAGAAIPLGDEPIFLADCLRAGLRVDHLPIDLAIHPADSSGTAFTPGSFPHRKAVLNRAFGPMAPIARAAFAWRHRRKFPGLAAFLRFFLP